jgi:phosphoribosylformylglycinamidine synthase
MVVGFTATCAISAYHDRSDGGVIATLLEMAFASHCGLDIVNGDISGIHSLWSCPIAG